MKFTQKDASKKQDEKINKMPSFEASLTNRSNRS